MPAPDARLILLTFPQRWDAGTLSLRVVVLPRGNPLDPLPGTATSFATAKLRFDAVLIPGLGKLPDPVQPTERIPLGAVALARKKAFFDELAARFEIKPAPVAAVPLPAATAFKTYLPDSYREAFAFRGPRTPFAFTDQTYACAVRNAAPSTRAGSPSNAVSWGQLLSFVLRQPRLAEQIGIVHRSDFALANPGALADGGWIFADLNVDSDYAADAVAQPELVARFAARLPPLEDAERRPLFAAVQFPVVPPTPPGPPDVYDQAAVEAVVYDDGFAKIVHGKQPRLGEVVEGLGSTPLTKDVGIRLGWDDEQIVIWMNRQIRADANDPTRSETDLPMGVSGYRVDVRAAGTIDWHSLVRVKTALALGPLSIGTFDDELAVEAVPIQLEGKKTGDYWLPSYLATWRGSSLVMPDPTEFALAGHGDITVTGNFKAVDDQVVPLRYGHEYDFRVRLRDMSGGGPEPGDSAVNPAPAPVARIRFRRFVPPQLVTTGPIPALAPGQRALTIPVFRPRLAYPAAWFTGVPGAKAALLADLESAKEEAREPSLPDPDVEWLEILVEVESLIMDTEAGSPSRDHYMPLYTTVRPFPANRAAPLALQVEFGDLPDIQPLRATDPLRAKVGQGPLVLPSARQVRLALTAIGKADPALDYFGDESARRSIQPVRLTLRAPSVEERALFAPAAEADRFHAILMQPEPASSGNVEAQSALQGRQDEAPGDIVGRLAKELSLEYTGLVLHGRPGRRTVFGCSAGLRHVLAPDGSTIAFASASDLVQQWIIAIRLRLARDWTWDALEPAAFEIVRDQIETVGHLQLTRSISRPALIDAERGWTDLVFFDAIDPKPDAGAFPQERMVRYTITAQFSDEPADRDEALTATLRLPVATRPAQTPNLLSAGMAASPYVRAEDYSSTEVRRRMLWLEFEHPPLDPQDRYYARVLASAPDPMLVPESLVVPDRKEPPLPIDPELIRVITPGQSADSAGLDAMQELIPSASSRVHVLLPLPPGLHEGSEELFGFFVYEIRAGHNAERWSTAQGRFGPLLRVAGVQHPAPALTCLVVRSARSIQVTAPCATPVIDGRSVRPTRPRTELWTLLYARVMQVDGLAFRNVLLARARARMVEPGDSVFAPEFTGYGLSVFEQASTEAALGELGLPRRTPLGVLALELLPEARHADHLRADPLGANLGQVRILRTSPLTPVPEIC